MWPCFAGERPVNTPSLTSQTASPRTVQPSRSLPLKRETHSPPSSVSFSAEAAGASGGASTVPEPSAGAAVPSSAGAVEASAGASLGAVDSLGVHEASIRPGISAVRSKNLIFMVKTSLGRCRVRHRRRARLHGPEATGHSVGSVGAIQLFGAWVNPGMGVTCFYWVPHRSWQSELGFPTDGLRCTQIGGGRST